MCYNNLRMYNKEKAFTLQAFTEWVSCDSNITVNCVRWANIPQGVQTIACELLSG